MSLKLSAVLGLIAGILAAFLAFVITFDAYSQKRLACASVWREALSSAVFAFVIFFLSSIALGYALRWVI